MDVLYKSCCGLDVHKETVAACTLIWERGRVHKEKAYFRDDDERAAKSGGLAERAQCHAYKHGIDWRVLEADLEHSGRAVRYHSGQCLAL